MNWMWLTFHRYNLKLKKWLTDPTNLSKKWKDKKVNFKKKGRKRSKRLGKGPGE